MKKFKANVGTRYRCETCGAAPAELFDQRGYLKANPRTCNKRHERKGRAKAASRRANEARRIESFVRKHERDASRRRSELANQRLTLGKLASKVKNFLKRGQR